MTDIAEELFGYHTEVKRLEAEIERRTAANERLRAALDRAADALEFYDNKAEAIKARAALLVSRM